MIKLEYISNYTLNYFARYIRDELGIDFIGHSVYTFELDNGDSFKLYKKDGDIIWDPEQSGYTRLHFNDYDSVGEFVDDIGYELGI